MRGSALSIGGYFTEMLDPSLNWDDVAEMVRHWNGQFCLKGVMSPADAKHAAEIGCTGIVVSNHGGRAAGSRSAVRKADPMKLRISGDPSAAQGPKVRRLFAGGRR